MNDGAGLPPLPVWGGRPAGIRSHGTFAQLDYSDPVWQHWVINTTLENLFPLGSQPPLASQVSPTISGLKCAVATASLDLAAIENATSTWLYGFMSCEASRCYELRFHLTYLLNLCSCGLPEDILAARELIRMTGRMGAPSQRQRQRRSGPLRL